MKKNLIPKIRKSETSETRKFENPKIRAPDPPPPMTTTYFTASTSEKWGAAWGYFCICDAPQTVLQQ